MKHREAFNKCCSFQNPNEKQQWKVIEKSAIICSLFRYQQTNTNSKKPVEPYHDPSLLFTVLIFTSPLRKHAYSNILKFLPSKNENLQMKNSDNLPISAQNIDCGYSFELPRRGGSNEYQQSMFLSRNKKNNVYPCKPQFYYIKVGFKGVKII